MHKNEHNWLLLIKQDKDTKGYAVHSNTENIVGVHIL